MQLTSSEMSSTSASEMCATPDHVFAVPRGPLHSQETSPCTPVHVTSLAKMEFEETPVNLMNDLYQTIIIQPILDYMQEFLSAIDKLKLANAKLQPDPGTAALKLTRKRPNLLLEQDALQENIFVQDTR